MKLKKISIKQMVLSLKTNKSLQYASEEKKSKICKNHIRFLLSAFLTNMQMNKISSHIYYYK